MVSKSCQFFKKLVKNIFWETITWLIPYTSPELDPDPDPAVKIPDPEKMVPIPNTAFLTPLLIGLLLFIIFDLD
jgi:hypothetical protein